MKQIYAAVLICLLMLCNMLHASNLRGQSSYWQCTASDTNHHTYQEQSSYKRKAVNMAFSTCKKHSKSPKTCSTSFETCTMVLAGRHIAKSWYCTAYDKTGKDYEGDLFRTRTDAYLGAKALCHHMSAIPKTCFTNTSTCKHVTQ